MELVDNQFVFVKKYKDNVYQNSYRSNMADS